MRCRSTCWFWMPTRWTTSPTRTCRTLKGRARGQPGGHRPVCGSGLEGQRASIVAADGTVTDGPPVTVGGLTVIEVPSREEAHTWAAKWAAACRCDQQIWELGFDPKIDAMRRRADNREPRHEDA